MKLKRFVALVTIVTMLGIGTVRPRPAHADTVTSIAIAFGALAVYLTAVFITTKMIYGNQPVSTSIDDPLHHYESRDGVRLVQACRQEGGNITVACW